MNKYIKKIKKTFIIIYQRMICKAVIEGTIEILKSETVLPIDKQMSLRV